MGCTEMGCDKDDATANRWLIFIAYVVGLSIGIHMLNLVTIPALGLIYYFKNTNLPNGVSLPPWE